VARPAALLTLLLTGNLLLFEFLVFGVSSVSVMSSSRAVQREADRNWPRNEHYRGSMLPRAATVEMRREVLRMVKRPESATSLSAVVNLLSYDDVLHLRNVAMIDRAMVGVGLALLLLGLLAGGLLLIGKRYGPGTARCYSILHGSLIVVFALLALLFRPLWYGLHLLLFTDPSWKLTAQHSFLPVLFPEAYARILVSVGLGVNVLFFGLVATYRLVFVPARTFGGGQKPSVAQLRGDGRVDSGGHRGRGT
jgi:hypothetical protein